jgi:hypothetical protein
MVQPGSRRSESIYSSGDDDAVLAKTNVFLQAPKRDGTARLQGPIETPGVHQAKNSNIASRHDGIGPFQLQARQSGSGEP